jgi:arginine-tRNA-protein transferase
MRLLLVVDVLKEGVVAVYTYCEPKFSVSYCTCSVLRQIEQTKQLKLRHVYLGYWIDRSPKMAYKAQFRPHQLLQDGQWQAPLPARVGA